MKCFRIDKSGYTGFDLLNPEQHFQGAIADTAPDPWGRRVIARDHAKRRRADPQLPALTELEDLRRSLNTTRWKRPPHCSDGNKEPTAGGWLFVVWPMSALRKYRTTYLAAMRARALRLRCTSGLGCDGLLRNPTSILADVASSPASCARATRGCRYITPQTGCDRRR